MHKSQSTCTLSPTRTVIEAQRRNLTHGISAAVLPLQDVNRQATQNELELASHRFHITDLLAGEPSDQPSQSILRRGKPTVTLETTPLRVPLSPIRSNNIPTDRMKKIPLEQMSENDSTTCLDRIKDAENTELFTYASTLCHRITGRYMSRDVLLQDPKAQTKEIARIQRDPELLEVISTIQTLSHEFKEIARDTLGHRKELGHALFRIEESYLKLFEKLLELSLRLYWRYERQHDREREQNQQEIQQWKEMYRCQLGEATKFQKLLKGQEILVRTEKITTHSLEQQCRDLEHDLEDQRALERRVHELETSEILLKERTITLHAQYTELERKHEEMIKTERLLHEELREQHKLVVDELKRNLYKKQQEIVNQTQTIRELHVQVKAPILIENGTQTQVDDDGLWDLRDGIPCFVSKNLQHRQAWRRFHAFVTCKNCHGRPIRHIDERIHGSTDHEYVDVWSLTRIERKSKKENKRMERIESEWELPECIRLFLSNLPKSVMAFPYYSLEEVTTQLEHIYTDKYESDLADEADGIARDELSKFLCEFFLKTHGLRQHAEIGLYRLLVSVKAMYTKYSHIHLFARFCHLLREDTSVRHTTVQSMEPGKIMTMLMETPRTNYLDRTFLRVYLHARYYLLRPPGNIPIPSILTMKGPKSRRPPPGHVIQVDPIHQWVNLDHAVALMRWYITYFEEDTVLSVCREIEYSTAIFAGGALTEVTGNRLAVRAEMRKAMLGNDESDSNLKSEHSRVNPRIVADVHRVLLLLMYALEQRQSVMEKELVQMFDDGDSNHDQVLSLQEFSAIIRTRTPEFSDRRILRMFREALMGGSDQSFALSMDAFVHVCNDHGLVALLPADRWKDPFPTLAQPPKVNKHKSPVKVPTEVPIKTGDQSEDAIESAGVIPEELPDTANVSMVLSPRAEEVEESDEVWQWEEE